MDCNIYPKKEMYFVNSIAPIKTHTRFWGVHLQISFPGSGVEPIDRSQDNRHRGKDEVTIPIRDQIDGVQWTVNSEQRRDNINGCEMICMRIQ